RSLASPRGSASLGCASLEVASCAAPLAHFWSLRSLASPRGSASLGCASLEAASSAAPPPPFSSLPSLAPPRGSASLEVASCAAPLAHFCWQAATSLSVLAAVRHSTWSLLAVARHLRTAGSGSGALGLSARPRIFCTLSRARRHSSSLGRLH